MFTVFTIKDEPQHIYFVNSEYFEQALKSRNIYVSDVMHQELSLEQLIRLKDRDYRIFMLFLV